MGGVKMNTKFNDLITPFEKDDKNLWQEYPRPQMQRDSYISLCKEWDLYLKTLEDTVFLGSIFVPYPPESRISNIQKPLKQDEKYIYKTNFKIDKNFLKDKILLHFGAVDQIAKVYINSKFAYEHIGGYTPFTVDITDFILIGENQISVEVEDNLDQNLSYGKQKIKRGGMWYTPISGIWQAVWIESVCKNYISNLKITPSLNSVKIETAGGEDKKIITVFTPQEKITKEYTGNSIEIEIENPILWSPENPYLYDFTLQSGDDTLKSYFALRTISIDKVNGKNYICLNGKPYYFHGLLDQGYYSDGIYTPYSPKGYICDILNIKKLGFNTLRKHIKLEPDLFYYYCDKYGVIVFQDMINSGEYHFFWDTLLPTLGIKKGISHVYNNQRKTFFENECREIIDCLYNHPCVCYYTIFNEGWGQFDADRLYKLFKNLDSSRIFDATSGWFAEKESDVDSRHIYFRKIDISSNGTKPLVLSEFGGYSYQVENHIFNTSKNYGYKTIKSSEQLTQSLYDLYIQQLIPCIEKGLNGSVLTQVSDVEDETNGLFTYDRQVIKVNAEIMREISDKIKDTFYKNIK